LHEYSEGFFSASWARLFAVRVFECRLFGRGIHISMFRLPAHDSPAAAGANNLHNQNRKHYILIKAGVLVKKNCPATPVRQKLCGPAALGRDLFFMFHSMVPRPCEAEDPAEGGRAT